MIINFVIFLHSDDHVSVSSEECPSTRVVVLQTPLSNQERVDRLEAATSAASGPAQLPHRSFTRMRTKRTTKARKTKKRTTRQTKKRRLLLLPTPRRILRLRLVVPRPKPGDVIPLGWRILTCEFANFVVYFVWMRHISNTVYCCNYRHFPDYTLLSWAVMVQPFQLIHPSSRYTHSGLCLTIT